MKGRLKGRVVCVAFRVCRPSSAGAQSAAASAAATCTRFGVARPRVAGGAWAAENRYELSQRGPHPRDSPRGQPPGGLTVRRKPPVPALAAAFVPEVLPAGLLLRTY